MLVIETLKCKISDFLNSNKCFYSQLYGNHLYLFTCSAAISSCEFSIAFTRSIIFAGSLITACSSSSATCREGRKCDLLENIIRNGQHIRFVVHKTILCSTKRIYLTIYPFCVPFLTYV